MNNDRVEGKAKDIVGRVKRQAGEWTGDPKKQAEGTAKQVAGKVQNAFGKAKDAVKNVAGHKPPQSTTGSGVEEEGQGDRDRDRSHR